MISMMNPSSPLNSAVIGDQRRCHVIYVFFLYVLCVLCLHIFSSSLCVLLFLNHTLNNLGPSLRLLLCCLQLLIINDINNNWSFLIPWGNSSGQAALSLSGQTSFVVRRWLPYQHCLSIPLESFVKFSFDLGSKDMRAETKNQVQDC